GISLPPRLRLTFFSMVSGTGLPAYFASDGLGSKVSTCDGPPFMKRKMIRFALGGKCGARGDSGLTARSFGSAAQSKPASAKTLARPRAPKPPPMRQRTSRRERAAVACSMSTSLALSIHVQELVGAEQHLGVLLPARQLTCVTLCGVRSGR